MIDGSQGEKYFKKTEVLECVMCCRKVIEDGDKNVPIYLAKRGLLGTLKNSFSEDMGQKTEQVCSKKSRESKVF